MIFHLAVLQIQRGDKMKYYNTIPEEQETIINIHYYNKVLYLYSSRKSVIQRLIRKLGEPSKYDYINKAISGASWNIKFDNKKLITSILSRPLLIGNIK